MTGFAAQWVASVYNGAAGAPEAVAVEPPRVLGLLAAGFFFGGLCLLGHAVIRMRRGYGLLGRRRVRTWMIDGFDLAAALLIAVGAPVLIVDILMRLSPEFDPQQYGAAVMGLGFFLAIAWIIDSVRNRHGATMEQFGLSLRQFPRGLAAGAVGYVAVFPLFYGAAALFHVVLTSLGHEPPMQDVMQRILKPEGPSWLAPLNIAYAVIGASIGEEVVFRGVLMRYLRSKTGPWFAIVVSSVLFGLVHLPHPVAMLSTAILGVALGVVFERTGSLWSCIVLHSMNNLVAVIFGFSSVAR